MPDEQTQQTTSTEQSSSATQQETPQSLDEVYKRFNVEETAHSFQPQPQVQVQQQPQKQDVSVPDPVLDAEGFKKYTASTQQSLQQTLSNIDGKLNAIQTERLRAREEADLKNAVQKFVSIVGPEVDEDLAHVAFGYRARKDPKFLAVYQNRERNPAAWNAAVSAYANEYKAKTQFKIDPNIAENQRAAKASIGSQVKQSKEEVTGDEALFKGKTGKEFNATWRNYIDRG